MKNRLARNLLTLILLILLLCSSFNLSSAAQEHEIYLPIVMKLYQTNPINPVINGDFEQGYAGWSWYPGGIMRTLVYSHSGHYSAMLGDGSHDRDAYINQQVNISASRTHLVFYRLMISSDVCAPDPHAYDYTAVTINSTEVWVEAACANNSSYDWVPIDLNLSAYAGQVVTLAFVFRSDSGIESRLYLDDIHFE